MGGISLLVTGLLGSTSPMKKDGSVKTAVVTVGNEHSNYSRW